MGNSRLTSSHAVGAGDHHEGGDVVGTVLGVEVDQLDADGQVRFG